jgi:hypothetical protein
LWRGVEDRFHQPTDIRSGGQSHLVGVLDVCAGVLPSSVRLVRDAQRLELTIAADQQAGAALSTLRIGGDCRHEHRHNTRGVELPLRYAAEPNIGDLDDRAARQLMPAREFVGRALWDAVAALMSR